MPTKANRKGYNKHQLFEFPCWLTQLGVFATMIISLMNDNLGYFFPFFFFRSNYRLSFILSLKFYFHQSGQMDKSRSLMFVSMLLYIFLTIFLTNKNYSTVFSLPSVGFVSNVSINVHFVF